ncbi:SCO6745 family protein [Actinomycetospora sp. CA-084318]|uniref:SCO6745 family protein n=1 Tax=Actinomycetospora sp. CA-084318 TaxID=3239892 RepID=UPI003D97A2CA
MDFDQARETFLQPREGATAPVADTPALRLRHVLEPLAMVHIWSAPAHEHMARAGLNFLTGYVGGRGATLGDVTPGVVAATFAVFEPGLAADLWRQARAACSVEELLAVRNAGGGEGLRAALEGVDEAEVGRVTRTLRDALDAGGPGELAGRPLYASLRDQPWPTDAHTALFHVASLYREHRGDAHLGACVAAGIDGLEANILTELRAGFDLYEYTGTRGWSPEAMDAAAARLTARGLLADGALTAAGRDARQQIEAATDLAQHRVVEALGSGLDDLVATLGAWADRVVAAGWFPPDPAKRAAG